MLKKTGVSAYSQVVFLVCVRHRNRIRLWNKKYFENTILQLKTRMEILSPKRFSTEQRRTEKYSTSSTSATAPKSKQEEQTAKSSGNAVGQNTSS
jgi:hypothetical protein